MRTWRLPCNSWMEFTYPEMTVTVSNPWVQIWKGGIRPLYDTRNDADTFAGVAAKLTEMTGDERMRGYFHFVYRTAWTSMRSGCWMRPAPSTATAPTSC